MNSEPTRFTTFPSPLGDLTLTLDGSDHLTGLWRNRSAEPSWERDDSAFAKVCAQMDAYFAGTRHNFDLPLNLQGTEFQRSVWHGLCEIPFGETISYGELARRLGNPKAMRAVGLANGRNPISIIVPCHRVIGADGSLTGYGGGLPMKKWLLEHEAQYVPLLRA